MRHGLMRKKWICARIRHLCRCTNDGCEAFHPHRSGSFLYKETQIFFKSWKSCVEYMQVHLKMCYVYFKSKHLPYCWCRNWVFWLFSFLFVCLFFFFLMHRTHNIGLSIVGQPLGRYIRLKACCGSCRLRNLVKLGSGNVPERLT